MTLDFASQMLLYSGIFLARPLFPFNRNNLHPDLPYHVYNRNKISRPLPFGKFDMGCIGGKPAKGRIHRHPPPEHKAFDPRVIEKPLKVLGIDNAVDNPGGDSKGPGK